MTDNLRILLVTSCLRGGGAGNYVLSLCRYLESVSIRAEILTITPQRHEFEDIFEVERFPVHRHAVSSLAWLITPASIVRLKKTISQIAPNIIHGHLYHGEMAAILIAALARVPLVTTRHSSGLDFNGFRRLPARLTASRIAAAIAVSHDAGRESRDTGVSEDRILVMPNGVDTRRFVPLDESDKSECRKQLIRDLFPGDVPPDPVLIGAAGALNKVKNYPLFIRVASKLLSANPSLRQSLRFVIAGEGGMRESLERQVREESLEEHLAIPGYLRGLDDYFPCLDIFLMTSISEGMPIALLEAMSSGAACVASDTGDIAEVIGDAGFAITPGAEESFLEVVSRLVADKAERKSLGQKARVRALEHYDIEIWGERIVNVYRSLLDRSPQ